MEPRIASSREESEKTIVLGLLDAVQKGDVTQRNLSRELGVAVGLVNAYLKRCVSKGLIKVQQIPRRRYAYYLTPKGFIEKSRLAASFLTDSFSFFRRARTAFEDAFAAAAASGHRRIVLVGASELAEIAVVVAIETKIEIVAVVDAKYEKPSFIGIPVQADLAGVAKQADAAMVTSLDDARATFDACVAAFGSDRVYAPSVLAVLLRAPRAEAEGERS